MSRRARFLHWFGRRFVRGRAGGWVFGKAGQQQLIEAHAGVRAAQRWAAEVRVEPLDVAAFGRPDSVVQVIEVEVNSEVAGQIAVPASRSVHELFIPGHRMRRHLNHFVLRYAWHRAPADLGLSEDVRELAVRVHQIDLRRH